MRALACTVAAAIALHAGAASAQDAKTVVKSVQAFYKGKKQATIKFKQTFTNHTFGKAVPAQMGMLYIKTPGKMRWNYFRKKKLTKSIISNSKYLYVVDHGNKEVIKQKLSKSNLPSAITFLYGKGDLLKDYTPAITTSSGYGTSNDIVLDLTPKAASAQVAELFLVVDASDYRVKQSVIVDSSQNTNHFEFFEPDFGKKIADTKFRFSTKDVPSYKVVVP